MEINVVELASEIATELMWEKYGQAWNEEDDPETLAKMQAEYDHIYETVFFGVIWQGAIIWEC